MEGGDWGSDDPPAVSEDQVHDCLRNLNIHKSIGPDEIHPRVLKELFDVAARPPSVIFVKSWQPAEVCGDWNKGSIAPIIQNNRNDDPENYKILQIKGSDPASLYSVLMRPHLENCIHIGSPQ